MFGDGYVKKLKFKEFIRIMSLRNYDDKVLEIKENIESVKDEFDMMYDELLSNKNFSQFKIDLFLKKIELLTNKYSGFINEYLNLTNITSEKVVKVSKIGDISTKCLLAITIAIVIFNAGVGILLALLGVALCYSLIKYEKNTKENITKRYEEIKDLSYKMNILGSNCTGQIKKKCEESYEKVVSVSNIEMTLANTIIMEYISTGNLLLSEGTILDLVIKILQDDLKSDETDLKILLDMAKKKTNELDNNLKEIKMLEKENKKINRVV